MEDLIIKKTKRTYCYRTEAQAHALEGFSEQRKLISLQ